jgi:hypothetical protein
MLDRLIAGAGAVTDAADRGVRSLLRTAGSHVADTRPGSAGLAGLLLVLAGGFVLVGLEANVGPLRTLAIGDVPDDGSLGSRVHAAMEGELVSTYVETYTDTDADGVQDEDEVGEAWAYWMVDADSGRGVTLLSMGAPWEVFQATYTGQLTTDREYVDETVDYVAEELGWMGITLDPEHIIDTTLGSSGAGVDHDLGEPWPTDGTTLTVGGPRSVTYVEWCSADPDDDGLCDDEEIDTFDVVIVDLESKTGVLVITDESPEFVPVSLSGILREDASAVVEAANAPGFSLADYDIDVSPSYVLDVGATPVDPIAPFILAALAALLGLIMLAGLAGGYIGYRRTGGPPAAATTLGVDGSIPLRLSGVIRTPQGPTHVRDVPAVLRRFVTVADTPVPAAAARPAASTEPSASVQPSASADVPRAAGMTLDIPPPAPAPESAPPEPAPEWAPPAPAPEWASAQAPLASSPSATDTPVSGDALAPAPDPTSAPDPNIPAASTLIVERVGRPEGVALGIGELQRLSIGEATTFAGSRPAIRAVAGTGPLILAFEDAAARDRAAAELVGEAGLDLGLLPSDAEQEA